MHRVRTWACHVTAKRSCAGWHIDVIHDIPASQPGGLLRTPIGSCRSARVRLHMAVLRQGEAARQGPPPRRLLQPNGRFGEGDKLWRCSDPECNEHEGSWINGEPRY